MERFFKILKEQGRIVFGAFLLAVGVNLFLTPNKLSTGGITSIGTMLLYLFSIRLSVTNLILNAVLFILGYRYLGKQAVKKTVLGILFFSLFLEITSVLPAYSGDLLIATVSGGVLCGAGVGLVMRSGASTGGSDFAALILKAHIPHVSLASLIFMIDGAVILASGIIFQSLEVTFYSLCSLFVSARLTDLTLSLGTMAKAVRIFSEKNRDIADHIMTRLERGVSGLSCQGMYSRKQGLMLLCIVSPKELPLLVQLVREADSSAFIVVEDVREVLGEGF